MRVASLIVALLLAACGGSVAPGAESTPTPGGGGGGVAPGALEDDCADQITPLVEALQDLNSRLNIGLTYADYGERVGDVRVLYDRIHFATLGPNCVNKVGIPAEDAMNDYIKAYQTWNACIEETGCSTDSIESKLQTQWSKATTKINEAATALGQ